jgi:hypothetical protein
MDRNLIFHTKTKHVECHYHFVQENVMWKEIDIVHIVTNQQHVDIFTKLLGKTKFEGLHQTIGIISEPIVVGCWKPWSSAWGKV